MARWFLLVGGRDGSVRRGEKTALEVGGWVYSLEGGLVAFHSDRMMFVGGSFVRRLLHVNRKNPKCHIQPDSMFGLVEIAIFRP